MYMVVLLRKSSLGPFPGESEGTCGDCEGICGDCGLPKKLLPGDFRKLALGVRCIGRGDRVRPSDVLCLSSRPLRTSSLMTVSTRSMTEMENLL
eukprot:Skav220081  [mRNA]  locus=scaffold262:306242:308433:- [translate_table: standard]